MKYQGLMKHLIIIFCVTGLYPVTALAVDETLPDSKVIVQALVDEIARSMNLQMEDLEKPYFIQYNVDDSIACQISASYGAIVSSDRERSREFTSQVRVGSYELDNTNFSGDRGGFSFFMGGGQRGGGRTSSLPLEDDYTALRQAIWWITDGTYKNAVETLTKKKAYMKDKNLKDRPHDFTRAAVEEHLEPSAKLEFDKATWEKNIKKLSALFIKYPQVQDSSVRFYVGAGNHYVVNSEGSRLRTGNQGVLLTASAEVQAEDGMKISDSRSWFAETPKELPPMEDLLQELQGLVDSLTETMNAPILESYTGPVLFDGLASGQLFREMLAQALAGRVDPVGTQRAQLESAGSLEKKLDQRILPKSFNVYDDPTQKRHSDTSLLGHYRYDDEGVKAQRVDLVTQGKLTNMVLSRVPTKKLSGSNGHGRKGSGSSINSSIGSLFIEDEEGMSYEALKEALIEAAKDEGLEYGLRISTIRSAGLSMSMSRSDIISFIMSMQQPSGRKTLGDPIRIYKVYVEDGREEMVRGCEFGSVKTRDLKQIMAAGETPTVYNYFSIGMGGASPPSSILAPPVLFEELELSQIEQENPKQPILKSPLAR